MKSSARAPQTLRFGVFELDLRSGELRKQGRRIRLEGQPVQVLIKLLEKPGELITREDLRKELWPADTFVNFEQSLNAAVKRLRHALGDAAANPRFIETLARRGYRFIAPVNSAVAPATPETQRPRAVESLAVLPFVNADADPETEYLADGITESIIHHVSRISSVRVMARSTVFRYKDKTSDPRTVGRKLNVDAVLLGRLQQRGDALLIAAELVDVQNGWRLWGEQYNRKLADILSVEEEMSREISEKLRVQLSGADRSMLAKRYTQSTEAYQDYLKGRYHLNRLTEEGLRKAIEHFERAIQRDQTYALAYAGLADSFGLLGFMGLAPAAEVMPKAKEAAMRSIAIDDGLAEGHASLAGVLKNYDWDWIGAEREYTKALELNPRLASGHRMYAAFLAALGRADQSLRASQLAVELDPFSLAIRVEVAYNLYMGRNYERALEEVLRTLDLEPQFAPAQSILGCIYEQQGRYDQALTALERARDLSGAHPATRASLIHILAAAGRMPEARELLISLEDLSRRRHVSGFWMALAYAGVGETSTAIEALYKAYDQRDVVLVWVGVEPRLDSLRREPRFAELLRRMGLPELADTAHAGQ